MESSYFPILQHLVHPFKLPTEEGERGELTLREKVQAIALAIFSGVASFILTGRKAAALAGVAVFYGLAAYHKILALHIHQLETVDQIPQVEEEPFQGGEEVLKKEQLEVRQAIPFFNLFLKPVIEAISQKAENPHLCFIKNNTAPYPIWFENEYKSQVLQKSFQKDNLLFFKTLCPEIDQGLFVSIRGDGDCTIRSIGTGLILQAMLKGSNVGLEELFNQFDQITKTLKAQSSHLAEKIQEMQKSVVDLQQKRLQQENLLKEHPERYREGGRADGYLNEEGQKMKASLDEIEAMMGIIENHVKELQDVKNQGKIQQQVQKLESSVADLKAIFARDLQSAQTWDEGCRGMITLMESEVFDQQLISFLRSASVVNILLNMEKMGNYVKQLGNQDHIISGEMKVFDWLMDCANARQPAKEYLQGGINDALSLSMLFQQPIGWYRSENAYEPTDRKVYHFGEDIRPLKREFYILNRPGHSDLIFI